MSLIVESNLLSPDTVSDIFELSTHSVYSIDEISFMYGVSTYTVEAIKCGYVWNHVTNVPIQEFVSTL